MVFSKKKKMFSTKFFTKFLATTHGEREHVFQFFSDVLVVRECSAQICAALTQHVTLRRSFDGLGPELVF